MKMNTRIVLPFKLHGNSVASFASIRNSVFESPSGSESRTDDPFEPEQGTSLFNWRFESIDEDIS